MSEKVNGLDDRPLGISVAINYQRKGELSLWHDCLLRLFPKPLKWDFWSNVHATTSTPSEEPIDKVRSSQSEQPRGCISIRTPGSGIVLQAASIHAMKNENLCLGVIKFGMENPS